MSEQLTDTPASHESYDWEQVAQEYQGWHPALQPYVEHNLTEHGIAAPDVSEEPPEDLTAPTPVEEGWSTVEISTGLDSEQAAEPAEAGQEAIPTLETVTQHFRDARQEIQQKDKPVDLGELIANSKYETFLKSGDYTEEQLDSLLHEVGMLSSAQTGQINLEGSPSLVFFNMLSYVPANKLKALYFSDLGGKEGGLREAFLQGATDKMVLPTMFDQLRMMNGLPDILALKDIPGYHQLDPAVEALTQRADFNHVALEGFWNDAAARGERGAALSQESSTAARDWSERYLKSLDLPDSVRTDFQFASYARTMDPTTGFADYGRMHISLRDINDRSETIDKATLEVLHDEAGITNFDYYSKEQLERTADVVHGDEATIANLKKGDVTMVMTDATGDHNGAMAANPEIFETTNGRSLFFEIRKPSDFYRHMSLLRKHGIKPATIVLAAHGAPGRMYFGAPGHDFDLENYSGEGTVVAAEQSKHLPLTSARGLQRLVADYMQPSRAIDDDPAAIGRKRLILKSCSQAAASMVQRGGRNDIRFGTEPMIETITRRVNNPELDIHGSEEVSIAKKTPNGYAAYTTEDGPNGQSVRDLPIVRMSVDKHGNIIESRLRTVVLRRTDKEVTHA